MLRKSLNNNWASDVLTTTMTSFAIKNFEGVFLYVNPAFCKLTGYPEDELIGRNHSVITHPEDVATTNEVLRRFSSGELSNYSWDKRYLNKSGRAIECRKKLTLLKTDDPQGEIILQIEDITEEARLKKVITQAEQLSRRLRSAIEQAPWGIAMNSADLYGEFRLDYANSSFARMHGYEADEMKGFKPVDLVSPGSNPDGLRLAALSSANGAFEGVVLRSRKDGTTFPSITSVARLADDKDQTPRFVVSVLDITERKTIVEEIRNLHQLGASLETNDSIEVVLNAAAESVARLLPCDRVSLIEIDRGLKKVGFFARGGHGKARINNTVGYAELEQGLSGWVLQHGQSALSPKGAPDSRESPEVYKRRIETNCGAIIVVPLQVGGTTLGTMTAINEVQDRDFTAQDVTLMEMFADYCSIVIQNARNFIHLKLSNQEVASLNTTLQKRNSLKDNLFTILAHDLRGPVGNTAVLIDMIVDQKGLEGDMGEILKLGGQAAH